MGVRNNRLSGRALAYLGTNAPSPSNTQSYNRAPTVNDSLNYAIGDFWLWLNTAVAPPVPHIYMLTSLIGGSAVWSEILIGAAGIERLTGNAGGAITGDVAHNINILGDNTVGLTVNGVLGTNTLTITSTSGNMMIATLTDDFGTAVGPDANQNINILGTAGQIVSTGTALTNKIVMSLDGSVSKSFLCDDTNSAVPAAGVLTVAGYHGLTTSVPAASTVRVALNNTITLGDLADRRGLDSLTLTTGNITLAGSTATVLGSPMITFGTGVDNHIAFPLNDVYIGQYSGNLTATHTGLFNVGVGIYTCHSLTSGTQNIAIGNAALQHGTISDSNVMIGYVAGLAITTGSNNTGIGTGTLYATLGVGLLTGSFNCAIGTLASGGSGSAYTDAESSNILIVNSGVIGESNSIRIGTHGAGNAQQNRCFIAGIRGITTAVADAIPVLISSTHQLGTVSSSIRYKENIKDMGDESKELYSLRPVTFNFKSDASKSKQYGLIAEEVIEHLPRLVIMNAEGEPETVKYHELPSLLLNEIIRLEKRIRELEKKLATL